MDATPSTLDPAAQQVIDDLYWNTSESQLSIATRFGLQSTKVPRLVTPLATGVDCWWCGRALVWVSRSERKNNGAVTCPGCRAQTSPRRFDPSLNDSDAVIMVTTGGQRSPADLSADITDGVSALAAVRLRWAGRFELVDIAGGPTAVRDAVVAMGVQCVVASSVRALGISQGDAFSTFRLLLLTEVRIITARDVLWASEYSFANDRYSNRWYERGAVGFDFPYDRNSDGGRSWSDEYRMLALTGRLDPDPVVEPQQERWPRW